MGINDLENVLADRAVMIRMVPKLPDEAVERYTESPQQQKESASIVDDLYLFSLANIAAMARLYHDSLSEIGGIETLANRQLDLWTPSLVLAHIVDGGSGKLSGEMIQYSREQLATRTVVDELENPTVQLIRCIQRACEINPQFQHGDGSAIVPTDVLLDIVRGGEAFAGISITTLSRRMAQLGIKTKPVRNDGLLSRGYTIDIARLKELAARYRVVDDCVSVTQV